MPQFRATGCSKDIATRFLAAVLDQPRVKKLLSTEHFTVDGTLDRSVGFVEEF